jgi:putative membrane protein
LLALTAVALLISAVRPHDWTTWWLEVAPVLIGALLLVPTYRRFPLSPLLYRLIFFHALVLILGAHYTYERVPLGEWARDAFNLGRNHYDRLGHFTQGFVPAILARELLLRRSPLVRGRWLVLICISICLAFSAFYELLEWWTALAIGHASEAFLGTQGDIWDTQWDMFLALCGATLAMALMRGLHDRSLLGLSDGGK